MMTHDTPEFIAAEEARKAALLSDIRMGEQYERERAIFHSKRSNPDEAGVTVTVRSLCTPDWSEDHEA